MPDSTRTGRTRRVRAGLATATALVAVAAGITQLATDWGGLLGATRAPGSPANILLYNRVFRVELVRATDDAPAPTQRLRDDLLEVLDGLVADVEARRLSAEQARSLGRRLGAILEEAPISAYQLHGRECTLRPGAAWLLPGGDDSITFVGPARDDEPNAVSIRRNGRESTMTVGAVREFRRGSETCRLLLHEVAADASAATFSWSCRS